MLVLAWLACARPAAAHPAPFSYVDIDLDAEGVRGSVVVHLFDAAHELGLPDLAVLRQPMVAREAGPALVSRLAGRMILEIDGRTVPLAWDAVEPEPERDGLRAGFHALGEAAGRLTLRAHLFPYDPQHQTFVNVYERGRLREQAILDARRTTFDYYAGTAAGVGAIAGTFVPSGIHHILIGPDHVLFLVALVILGGTVRRLLAIVTSFTLGHSLTLSLAATGLVTPPATIVEPAIALSIVVVGLDNLMVRGRPQARDLRPWAALAFGLVHGFGFASVLREMGLPGSALGWSLLSFNVGVEIGQVVVVLAVATLVLMLRRHSTPLAERVVVAGSIAVVVAGSWWFAQRVFFPGGL